MRIHLNSVHTIPIQNRPTSFLNGGTGKLQLADILCIGTYNNGLIVVKQWLEFLLYRDKITFSYKKLMLCGFQVRHCFITIGTEKFILDSNASITVNEFVESTCIIHRPVNIFKKLLENYMFDWIFRRNKSCNSPSIQSRFSCQYEFGSWLGVVGQQPSTWTIFLIMFALPYFTAMENVLTNSNSYNGKIYQ